MSTERTSAVASALTMIALLAAICASALARHPPAREPARLPAAACAPWMADALPGVGRKTRDAAAAAIRSGDLAKLPPAARTRAREWFDF